MNKLEIFLLPNIKKSRRQQKYLKRYTCLNIMSFFLSIIIYLIVNKTRTSPLENPGKTEWDFLLLLFETNTWNDVILLLYLQVCNIPQRSI